VGVTGRADALADWPGGRVVLGRPPEQVSRAEWKLEELLKLDEGRAVLEPVLEEAATSRGQADRGHARRALDLGAAPGGWTRVLRNHGFEVWAIDPGELHPAVAEDQGVHHVRTTAGRFFSEDEGRYGLVVNDMRMTAERSARVVVDAASRLVTGGVAVMTLKLPSKRPLPAVERSLEILGAAYEPVLARQLFHNRNEVTVVARRLP
jgi:23S rRNA (cytidine2498-2'-O)-methyltransferase